jgi:tRNA(Ile)-lysidine synthase
VRTADTEAVSASEAAALFSSLIDVPVLVLAVSGGPDSTALMALAARWRDGLAAKPKLIAVTVDHGLRQEAKDEAAAAARLARQLHVAHRTLRWTGRKPATGLQEAARLARYRLLARAAHEAGARHVLTAHTLDDQAETVLIRLTRGSGLTGLGAMQRISVIPGRERSERTRNPYSEALRRMDSGPGPLGRPGMTDLILVRPLLDIPKSRLIATLRVANIPFADDPSNRDPRFTRARLRALMPALAEEGLDARRLALLARRLRRADVALETTVDEVEPLLYLSPGVTGRPGASIVLDAPGFATLPAEVALRLLGRAVAAAGDEGPVELAKLEALHLALEVARSAPDARFRRSLAGAVVSLTGDRLTVERAPRRRAKGLTTRRSGKAGARKSR